MEKTSPFPLPGFFVGWSPRSLKHLHAIHSSTNPENFHVLDRNYSPAIFWENDGIHKFLLKPSRRTPRKMNAWKLKIIQLKRKFRQIIWTKPPFSVVPAVNFPGCINHQKQFPPCEQVPLAVSWRQQMPPQPKKTGSYTGFAEMANTPKNGAHHFQ